MRLLKIEDDGSLSFTKDLVRGIPPYAILSHTWGDDDQEIQYQDIIQGIGKEKEGYRKIEFCRKQAAIHGLQHFWVDTCCINKTNFTELSEAINSMFRWYQDATRCYVYLSDVSFRGDYGAAEEELRRPTWKSDLRKSRWFTRGWTLQELIAPAHVEFFAAKGQIEQWLGDKKGLHQLLCDITDIPTGAFRRGLMAEFTIEERMSWIKGRATTRPEDLAYCLFGIFDVQLPILYGEGQTKALERLRKEVDVQSPVTEALNKLPVVEGTAFDSHAQEHETTCLEDTRVDLLREISQWVQNPRGKNVFWLNGMAGTGKSTISRTIAQFGAADNQLGASYFFKRGENDRSSVTKLFSTIAAQMVSKRPAMASYVLEVLNSESMVLQKSMQKQLGSLILDPLSKLAQATGMDGAIPIVIDALDECEREDDVKVLIKLFCEFQQPQPFRLKFLVTSRPDLPIRLGFQAVEGNYQDLILHEIYEPIIEHDIRVYIRHQLRHIKECYDKSVPEPRRLPSAWPTESDTETLVHMAVPLFIFAATSCRFIADRRIGNPEEQLIEVLTYKTKSQESQLDGTYFPVLNQMVRGLLGKQRTQVLERYRSVVGRIVNLQTPLSATALASLADMSEGNIYNALDALHPVMSVPYSSCSPIRLLHLSFRDFLLDPDKRYRSPFWIDEAPAHAKLAEDCIRLMDKYLRADICDIRAPGTRFSSINPSNIREKLAAELQYACQYWYYHLQQARSSVCDGDQVNNFLTHHFLHWVEAMTLIGRLSEVIEGIRILRSILQVDHCDEISEFLKDAIRFVTATAPVIYQTPLQIYSSSLAFAPTDSLVRRNYWREAVKWIQLEPIVERYWGQCLLTFSGHRSPVEAIAVSRDGKLVASGDSREVLVWSVATGIVQQTIPYDPDTIYGFDLQFSPDGGLIMIACDTSIQTWSTTYGTLQGIIETYDTISQLATSPDGKFLATASSRGRARVWLASTGTLHQELNEASHSVAFSPDGTLVATNSSTSIMIWVAATGALQQRIEGFDFHYGRVIFSPSLELVACTRDCYRYKRPSQLEVWSFNTGVPQQVFRHQAERIENAVFSPDGVRLALVVNGDCQVWASDTGTIQQALNESQGYISSIIFFPDGHTLLSASGDCLVRIWSATQNAEQDLVQIHTSNVTSIAFSADGTTVVSASRDCTIRTWSAMTGAMLRTFEGHREEVSSVAFSPDGQFIVSASFDRTVRLWSAATGELYQRLEEGIMSWVRLAIFSQDQEHLLLMDVWRSRHIWSKAKHNPLRSPSQVDGSGYCYHSSTSADGGHIIGVSLDGEVVVLRDFGQERIPIRSAKTGILHRELMQGECFTSVAFSLDGKLVAALTDKWIQFWSIETGNLLIRVYLDVDSSRLSFVPKKDGYSLLTESGKMDVTLEPSEILGPGRTVIDDLELDNCYHVGYWFNKDRTWITHNGVDLLRIPPERRPTCSAVSGSTVAFGSESGRVYIMRLAAEELSV